MFDYCSDSSPRVQVLKIVNPAAAVRQGAIQARDIKQSANLSDSDAKDLVLKGTVPAKEGVVAGLISAADAFNAKLLTTQEYAELTQPAAAATGLALTGALNQ